MTTKPLRYRAPDGTELAYDISGTGSRSRAPFVLTNGLSTTTTFWNYLRPRWEQEQRVLTWDMPGHGASSPARSEPSALIAEQPELLVQLMDEAGFDRAVHIGWSTGCQVVLEMYRRYPQRCRALVLLIGSAGRVLSTSTLPLPGPAIEWIVQHIPRPVFGIAAHTLARFAHTPVGQLGPRVFGLVGKNTSRRDALSITEHLQRIDSATVQTMIASAQAHDAWDVLPTIQVPVLIVAGDLDPFAPAATVGVEMHARCPLSELLRLPEATHTALFDHAAQIGAAVDDFVARRVAND